MMARCMPYQANLRLGAMCENIALGKLATANISAAGRCDVYHRFADARGVIAGETLADLIKSLG